MNIVYKILTLFLSFNCFQFLFFQKVTNLESTFQGASKFNGDISSWETTKVTNMKSMFQNAVEFNQDLDFDTQKVKYRKKGAQRECEHCI